MTRPELNEIPVAVAIELMFAVPNISVTMSIGQWDCLLQTAYEEDCILLEIDDDERLVKAYRQPRC